MKLARQLATLLLFGALCIALGCSSDRGRVLCDDCADITPGAIPQPTGAHACAWQSAQSALAERDDFVIYPYEWVGHTSELSPFGRRHVDGLAHRLEMQPYQVMLEPAENAGLDAERRAALVERLLARGLLDAEERVTIGYGLAEGLDGQEAPRMNQGYLRGGAGRGGMGGRGTGFGGAGGFGGSGGFGDAGGFGGIGRN